MRARNCRHLLPFTSQEVSRFGFMGCGGIEGIAYWERWKRMVEMLRGYIRPHDQKRSWIDILLDNKDKQS